MGERFSLERSVQHDCPLAPYLFLFFAKAMTHFFRAPTTGLHGVHLPIRDSAELLDSKYVDDMAFCV